MTDDQAPISVAATTTESTVVRTRSSKGWVEFLQTTPPGEWVDVGEYARSRRAGQTPDIIEDDLLLYCGSDICAGDRNFKPTFSGEWIPRDQSLVARSLTYICRNCRKSHKVFALWFDTGSSGDGASIVKIGEHPDFGPPLTPRVLKLVDNENDRDELRKGYRSERQGLGVGAYGYYRRVVENQKNRIIDEIVRVAKTVGADAEALENLSAARKETQFTRAVEKIKHGMPQSLLVSGHNPLTLLHGALSEGLHARTDAECLEEATAIRVVLTDLAERMAQALKDDRELQSALGKLLNRKKPE